MKSVCCSVARQVKQIVHLLQPRTLEEQDAFMLALACYQTTEVKISSVMEERPGIFASISTRK